MEPEGRTGRGNRGEVTSEGKWGGRELLAGAPGVSDAPALRLIDLGVLAASQVFQGQRLCVLDLGKAFRPRASLEVLPQQFQMLVGCQDSFSPGRVWRGPWVCQSQTG